MPDSTTSDAVRASISRRGLLTSAFAGGLVYAFRVPVLAANDFAPSEESGAGFVPNGFIRVDGQGNTIVVVPQVEMGQGIYTGLATVVAEELDADFDKVTVEHAPPNEKLYVNPLLGIQATGGSTSILAFWGPMRSAGATARAMLIQAAASRWGVGVGDLKTKSGQVIHPDGEKRLSYGELAEAAGRVAAPKDVPLKDPKDFVLIGKPLKRIDARNKVNGKTTYGIDVKLPGMAFATLAQSPVFGGKVAQVDDKAARAIQGVRQVIVLNDTVAVVGDHMWAAKSGIEALKISWALPRRVGRGVSVQPTFGTAMATVVEAEIDAKGEILLRRVTVALDCGIAVNPDTIVAQIEGGMVFGLTAALYGEITINRGRVQQSNFHDYRMLRIDEVPTIEVHLVKSGEPPGGIGETGVVGGPPALRNAIYAATGVALRRLPIERELLAEKKQ